MEFPAPAHAERCRVGWVFRKALGRAGPLWIVAARRRTCPGIHRGFNVHHAPRLGGSKDDEVPGPQRDLLGREQKLAVVTGAIGAAQVAQRPVILVPFDQGVELGDTSVATAEMSACSKGSIDSVSL